MMAATAMPGQGQREGHGEEDPQRLGAGVAGRLLEAARHRRERRGRDPGHEDHGADDVHDEDAEDRLHEVERVEQGRHRGEQPHLGEDHGTINVKNPSKVIGDKNTSLNLRYKTGRSLTYEYKDVYAVKEPKNIGLPAINMSSSYIFAKNDLFFGLCQQLQSLCELLQKHVSTRWNFIGRNDYSFLIQSKKK